MTAATLNGSASRSATPRCRMVREGVSSRRIPCNRPAAEKWGYRYCGNCAADLLCRALDNGTRTHKPGCLGCGLDCCADRAKCVPGRCRLFVNRRYVDVTVEQIRRAADGERTRWPVVQPGTRFEAHGSTWLVEHVDNEGRYTVRAVAGRNTGHVSVLGPTAT
jgi:hypothetical protein